MKLIPSPQASLTQATYERVREEVLSCRLVPGSRINTKDLSDHLGVNVGAVREALSRLTSEELVIAEPQKGFRVAPISAEDLRDLTSVRIDVERMCLERSIPQGDVSWEARILAAYHRLSKAAYAGSGSQSSDGQTWNDLHNEFHESLVAACDSPWLLRMRRLLFQQNRRYRSLSVSLTAEERDLDGEHRALMEAAMERDVDTAVALMTRHIQLTSDAVLEHVYGRGMFDGASKSAPTTGGRRRTG